MEGIIRAWGKILTGYQPNLSIEITRECPLTCPGCYAYGSEHLGGEVTLRELQDFKGQQLVDAMFALLDKYKPLHVSIVGGEPLVRFRELNEILPRMAEMGIYTQLVTSAVRPIPARVGGPAPPAARRLDRRTAARARRAAQARHLRAHSQAHRRARHPRALHGDAPAGAPRRLPRGVCEVLVGQSGRVADLDQPLHAAGRRDFRRAPDEGGPPEGRDRSDSRFAPGIRSCARRRRCSSPTSCRRTRPTTASSRRPRPACRRTSRSRSRRASSAAIPTAPTAAASRLRRWPPSAATSCPAASASGSCSMRRSEIGTRVRAIREAVDGRRS